MTTIDRKKEHIDDAIAWAKGESFASIARRKNVSPTRIRQKIYILIRKLRRDHKCRFVLEGDSTDSKEQARALYLKSFENLLSNIESSGFLIPDGITRIITTNTEQKKPITRDDLKRLVDEGVIYPGFAPMYKTKKHNQVLDLLGRDPIPMKKPIKNKSYERKCIDYLERCGYTITKK